MGRAKMQAGDIATDSRLVRRLLRHQFPRWADLPIEMVPSHGTDHDIYRLGDQLCARMPRTGWAAGQAEREAVWLPRLAPQLPLALPVQVALGQPADGYPFTWSVCQWLPGGNANGTINDLRQAAADLAAFVTAMRRIDTTGAPPRSPGARGGPLAEGDERVRRSIKGLGDRIDGTAVTRSWEESLAAQPWNRDVWVHGDLLPGNLLVNHGRLSAVIDWGGLNAGDPACDLQPAWNTFAGHSRKLFLSELGADDDACLRGRGWTLYQAITGLYYWDTNPGMIRQASHALAQVLASSMSTGQTKEDLTPELVLHLPTPVRAACLGMWSRCDGMAPAVPVVRLAGQRSWRIRVPWRIRCIPIPSIHRQARIHPANRGQDAGDGPPLR